MSDKEKKIIETISNILPNLSKEDKSYLLGLGEGMAIAMDINNSKTKDD